MILYIIDLDGFASGRVFYTKELGYVNLRSGESGVYRYNLPKDFKPSATSWFCTKFVHGLTTKYHREDYPSEYVLKHLAGILDDIRRNENVGLRIGYKGGNIERDLLTQLGAAPTEMINIETLGVPRFDTLVLDETLANATWKSMDEKKLVRCIRHKPVKDRHNGGYKEPHCPLTEVHFYAQFLIANAPYVIPIERPHE